MTCVTDSCRQGRDRCPTPEQCCERTRRVQEAEMRWTSEIGYEAADPALMQPLPVQFAGTEPQETRWPFVLVAALVAIVSLGWLAAYLLTEWESIWPRLVVVASF